MDKKDFARIITRLRQDQVPGTLIGNNFPDRELALYYWNQLKNKLEGKESIYPGRVFKNEIEHTISIVDSYSCYLKLTDHYFLELTKYFKTWQKVNPEKEPNYKTKHYVLAYLFECNAKGERFPSGHKKEFERIGNERMGTGKGNRFYKVFNEISSRDLNAENDLIEIGGEDWRKAVIELSKAPELVEEYLQKKQL